MCIFIYLFILLLWEWVVASFDVLSSFPLLKVLNGWRGTVDEDHCHMPTCKTCSMFLKLGGNLRRLRAVKGWLYIHYDPLVKDLTF